jgi:hypothetical protein
MGRFIAQFVDSSRFEMRVVVTDSAGAVVRSSQALGQSHSEQDRSVTLAGLGLEPVGAWVQTESGWRCVARRPWGQVAEELFEFVGKGLALFWLLTTIVVVVGSVSVALIGWGWTLLVFPIIGLVGIYFAMQR